jgi:hypothetical protein
MKQKQKMWVNFGFGTFFLLFFVLISFGINRSINEEMYGQLYKIAIQHPALFLCIGVFCFILMAIFGCIVRMICKTIYAILLAYLE